MLWRREKYLFLPGIDCQLSGGSGRSIVTTVTALSPLLTSNGPAVYFKKSVQRHWHPKVTSTATGFHQITRRHMPDDITLHSYSCDVRFTWLLTEAFGPLISLPLFFWTYKLFREMDSINYWNLIKTITSVSEKISNLCSHRLVTWVPTFGHELGNDLCIFYKLLRT